MITPFWDAVRLSLHVLAATVWVGGQLVLAALVPTLRAVGAEVPKVAARRFNQVAWPAFGVLVATGVWNIVAVEHDDHPTSGYHAVLSVKLALVAVSGATAYLHARARTPAGLAVFGALTGLSALAALVLGVVLAG
jgi:putative copper export protein